VMRPQTLDTIVATNLHADILSDLAAALAGSLGIANPVATFLTAAMMLEHLGQKPAANRLMRAVEGVTAQPALHTPDLGGKATTQQVTDAVCEALRQAKD
jgi:tartrate dehydrogenase/decarboxylase / D-malate dehydrogenase